MHNRSRFVGPTFEAAPPSRAPRSLPAGVTALVLGACLAWGSSAHAGDEDLAEAQGFYGTGTLSDGTETIAQGLRVRQGEDQPWTTFGVLLKDGALRFVIDPAPGVLPFHSAQLMQFIGNNRLEMEWVSPHLLLMSFEEDPVTGELFALLNDGELTLFDSVPFPACITNALTGAGGTAGGDSGDDLCPDNNCTEWLRSWLEDLRAEFRKAKNFSAAWYIGKLLENESVYVDRDNDYTDPDKCEGVFVAVLGFGSPAIYFSPACIEEGLKGKVAAFAFSGALTYSDPAVARGDEEIARKVIGAIHDAYVFIDLGEEHSRKLLEFLKKMLNAVGVRQGVLNLCLILEAMDYRGEGTPEVLKKLKRIAREIAELEKKRGEMSASEVEKYEEWLKGRYAILRALILSGQWDLVHTIFGIPPDCIDPALVECVAQNPTICGDPATGPCDEPGESQGCQDTGCCESVCKIDPFCCEHAWDEQCVDQAAACAAPLACFETQAGCCLAHDGPGCANAACCGAVCADDPFCCDVVWDELCALQSTSTCATICGEFAMCGDGNAGDCCSFNANASCSDAICCAAVCEGDEYCCQVRWDTLCAEQAAAMCEDVCLPLPTCADAVSGSSPCAVHETPFADAPGCCEAVCEVDPYCCLHAWDQICVLGAQEFCDGLCPPLETCSPDAGSCFEAGDLPGCDDPTYCGPVCEVDSFCCDVHWDDICVWLAQDAKAGNCPYFCPPCQADLTGDGFVGVPDLLQLLASWGVCAVPGDCPADLNTDGSVGVPDLLSLLQAWGPCPE